MWIQRILQSKCTSLPSLNQYLSVCSLAASPVRVMVEVTLDAHDLNMNNEVTSVHPTSGGKWRSLEVSSPTSVKWKMAATSSHPIPFCWPDHPLWTQPRWGTLMIPQVPKPEALAVKPVPPLPTPWAADHLTTSLLCFLSLLDSHFIPTDFSLLFLSSLLPKWALATALWSSPDKIFPELELPSLLEPSVSTSVVLLNYPQPSFFCF